MKRLDLFLVRRLLGRIGIVALVVYTLIFVVEAVDLWRLQRLIDSLGTPLAMLALASGSARWLLKALPVVTVIGAIWGLIELQRSREILVAKAAGFSIWRILAAPVSAVALLGVVSSLGIDTLVTTINRDLNPTLGRGSSFLGGRGSEVWLSQSGGDQSYVLVGRSVGRERTVLSDVQVFLADDPTGARLVAQSAELGGGTWTLMGVTRMTPDAAPSPVPALQLPTTTTPGDLTVMMSSREDMTLLDLGRTLMSGIGDPATRAAVGTRFFRMITLPVLMVGTLLIAFAFTSGYRRVGDYGLMVFYGIILGFVVFVITEMAEQAGSAGVLAPAFAGWAPAAVAIVIGVTVLLFREDGRT